MATGWLLCTTLDPVRNDLALRSIISPLFDAHHDRHRECVYPSCLDFGREASEAVAPPSHPPSLPSRKAGVDRVKVYSLISQALYTPRSLNPSLSSLTSLTPFPHSLIPLLSLTHSPPSVSGFLTEGCSLVMTPKGWFAHCHQNMLSHGSLSLMLASH